MYKNNSKPVLRILTALFLQLTIVVLLTSCDQNKKKPEEIIIFAAASLTESFAEIGQEFNKLHDTKIIFNFAGSQSLATSIKLGMPCDVFASANIKYMEELKAEKLIDSYEIFAGNELIACKSSLVSKEISKLSELADSSIRLITGDKEVPVGKYFFTLLDSLINENMLTDAEKKEIIANIRSQEISVKDIVTKLITGEGDYGIIYRTDINPKNREQLTPVYLEELNGSSIDYPIGLLGKSEHKEKAQEFIDFILSEEGKNILRKHNFSTK